MKYSLYDLFNDYKDDVTENGDFVIWIPTIYLNEKLSYQLVTQGILTLDIKRYYFNGDYLENNQCLIYNIKTGEIKKYYVVRNYECK